jgi:hypothetical protein
MTDLHALLDREVDHAVEVDTVADVRRGRAALRRRRRVVVAGAVAGVLVLGGGLTAYARSTAVPTAVSPTDDGTVHAGGFRIPAPPEGWSVQAADESRVVVAPDGSPKTDFDDPHLQLPVMGKLLVHLQHTGLPVDSSTTVELDGRTFYVYPGGGPLQVGVPEPAGGWLILQDAPRLHWTTQQLVDYLDEVEVLPDAAPDSD